MQGSNKFLLLFDYNYNDFDRGKTIHLLLLRISIKIMIAYMKFC